jgi:hypothetical protein
MYRKGIIQGKRLPKPVQGSISQHSKINIITRLATLYNRT